MDDWENVHVGTSGWHYGDWAGPFYPKDLSKKDFLAFYAEHFHTVEINNSFYQLPKEETLRGWRKAVPQEFVAIAYSAPSCSANCRWKSFSSGSGKKLPWSATAAMTRVAASMSSCSYTPPMDKNGISLASISAPFPCPSNLTDILA